MTDKNIQKWTVLEEQDVSPSHWFPVTKQKVKLANNNVYDYYFSKLGDVVQVLAITKQNEVVLVKQYKHGLGEVVLELPGGMQQKDTSLIQSALNELEEETGIKTTAKQLISLGKIAINPTKLKQVTYGFIMFNAEFNSVQQLEDTEDIQIVLKPAPEVLQLALNGGIWVTDSVSFILRAAMMYPDVFRVTEGIGTRDL
nr:NUDIX hydrolase [uncultured Mucilaginibacter sp.]